MSQKKDKDRSKAGRQKLQQDFHAKLISAEKTKPATLSVEDARLAAIFLLTQFEESPSFKLPLPAGVMTKIANGNFPANEVQRREISTAAHGIHWAPPEA